LWFGDIKSLWTYGNEFSGDLPRDERPTTSRKRTNRTNSRHLLRGLIGKLCQ